MGPNYYVSPSSPSNGLSKKTLYIIAGLVAAIIIGGLLLLSTNSGNDTSTVSQRLLSQLEDLYSFTSDRKYTRDLKNDTLLTTNTELALSLSTNLNTVRPLLQKQITTNSPTAKETTSAKKLEAAKTNNKLDREFQSILLTKIESTRATIVAVYPSLKGVDVKNGVVKTNETLKTYQVKLENISL